MPPFLIWAGKLLFGSEAIIGTYSSSFRASPVSFRNNHSCNFVVLWIGPGTVSRSKGSNVPVILLSRASFFLPFMADSSSTLDRARFLPTVSSICSCWSKWFWVLLLCFVFLYRLLKGGIFVPHISSTSVNAPTKESRWLGGFFLWSRLRLCFWAIPRVKRRPWSSSESRKAGWSGRTVDAADIFDTAPVTPISDPEIPAAFFTQPRVRLSSKLYLRFFLLRLVVGESLAISSLVTLWITRENNSFPRDCSSSYLRNWSTSRAVSSSSSSSYEELSSLFSFLLVSAFWAILWWTRSEVCFSALSSIFSMNAMISSSSHELLVTMGSNSSCFVRRRPLTKAIVFSFKNLGASSFLESLLSLFSSSTSSCSLSIVCRLSRDLSSPSSSLLVDSLAGSSSDASAIAWVSRWLCSPLPFLSSIISSFFNLRAFSWNAAKWFPFVFSFVPFSLLISGLVRGDRRSTSRPFLESSSSFTSLTSSSWWIGRFPTISALVFSSPEKALLSSSSSSLRRAREAGSSVLMTSSAPWLLLSSRLPLSSFTFLSDSSSTGSLLSLDEFEPMVVSSYDSRDFSLFARDRMSGSKNKDAGSAAKSEVDDSSNRDRESEESTWDLGLEGSGLARSFGADIRPALLSSFFNLTTKTDLNRLVLL